MCRSVLHSLFLSRYWFIVSCYIKHSVLCCVHAALFKSREVMSVYEIIEPQLKHRPTDKCAHKSRQCNQMNKSFKPIQRMFTVAFRWIICFVVMHCGWWREIALRVQSAKSSMHNFCVHLLHSRLNKPQCYYRKWYSMSTCAQAVPAAYEDWNGFSAQAIYCWNLTIGGISVSQAFVSRKALTLSLRFCFLWLNKGFLFVTFMKIS